MCCNYRCRNAAEIGLPKARFSNSHGKVHLNSLSAPGLISRGPSLYGESPTREISVVAARWTDGTRTFREARTRWHACRTARDIYSEPCAGGRPPAAWRGQTVRYHPTCSIFLDVHSISLLAPEHAGSLNPPCFAWCTRQHGLSTSGRRSSTVDSHSAG